MDLATARRWLRGALVLMVSAACTAETPSALERLLDEIAFDFRSTAYLTGRKFMRPSVRAALAAVPRHEFVASGQREDAYENRPLVIGHGQTISQPFVVALMTDLLDLEGTEQVLEIGTGSGYQAAVLARCAAHVYTIEIVPELGAAARGRLQRLGYSNVEVRIGDGNLGWPEHAPFDAIIVTAAGRLPAALVEQLKPGGRMVIPLGERPDEQTLTVVTKDTAGAIQLKPVLPVRFVPLTGNNR